MSHRCPMIPPSLKSALDNDQEVEVFQKFQSSSTFRQVLPGCDATTEYNQEHSTWTIPAAKYLDELFRPSKDGSPMKTDLTPSWSDVLELIRNAEAQYEGTGDKNRLRRRLRRGQDVAVVLNGLVELIPDEHGLGVLRVALSKLFTGWIDRIKNREKVLIALGDIPMTLGVALERWHSFRTDEQLKKAARQLHEECIQAIRGLSDVLNHKPGSTSTLDRLKYGLKQALPKHEADMIDEILQPVTVAKANVDNNIDRLDRVRAAETHQNTEFSAFQGIATHKVVQDTKILVTDVFGQVEAQRQETTAQFGHLQTTVQNAGSDMSSEVSGLKGEVSQLKTMLANYGTMLMGGIALIPPGMNMQWQELMHTSFYHLNTEQIWKRGLLPPPRTPSPAPQYPPTPLAPERLIDIIGILPVSSVADRDAILRKGHSMSQELLGHGRYLLSVPSFQHLLSSPVSGLLLVDGHCKEDCEGKVSPISVFCASLAAMMAQDPARMVLHFFAGQHCFNDPNDQARGPRGLMRSLICQVLLYPNQPYPHLDWLADNLIDDVAEGEIGALCHLFEQLLQRVIGVSVIFCMVDNISEFERSQEGWCHEINIVFDCLSSLYRSLAPGVSFKLLVTSADKSTQLVWQTDPSERLSLRAKNMLSPEKSATAMDAAIRRSVSSQSNGEPAEGHW